MIKSTSSNFKHKIFVVIATAFNRYDYLLQRSLLSVYKQVDIDSSSIEVIIVDDNKETESVDFLIYEVEKLRTSLQLEQHHFKTQVLKNQRTPNMSGTGAWNTGIYKAFENDSSCFVSILDDDDEYLPNHLMDCLQVVITNPDVEAVFQEIIWKNDNQDFWHFPLLISDITPESFFIGNPGIQGSNLFVKASTLVAIDGFNEVLASATDRDLMIRLLWLWSKKDRNYTSKFTLVNIPGAVHYLHDFQRITSNVKNKQLGLTTFYEIYKTFFSLSAYHASLKRAQFNFQYQPIVSDEIMVIGVTMHNNSTTIENSILSILEQKATKRDTIILISDDNSTDGSSEVAIKLSKRYANIVFEKGHFGNAAKNRNHIQTLVQKRFPNCILLGRLDADDELADTTILQQIETLYDAEKFDVLFMSNNQVLNGKITGFINTPDEKLVTHEFLLARLQDMAQGKWEAELPSCNIFVNPTKAIAFEDVFSAEDHRNFVDYVLQNQKLKLVFKPDWIYANYSIDKHFDENNNRLKAKLYSREMLYRYAKNETTKMNRKSVALSILKKVYGDNFIYLGAGFSGVVFHDGISVYKVHIPLTTNNFNEIDNILFLKEKLQLFANRKHFFPLEEFFKIDDYYVLKYPYELGVPVTSLNTEDMISFLAEMWQMKVICRSITKENNFMRYNGVIKLIDYEIESYSDNLFLNLAARAFIQLQDYKYQDSSYDKLKRSTINNFDLLELEGFYDFVAAIFKACSTTNFSTTNKTFSLPNTLDVNSKIAYNGLDNPKVNLLIKACIQDAEHLYHDVCFLVAQLTKSVSFHQRVLSLELYKKNNFLRQYSTQGTEKELLAQAQKLVAEGVIDAILISPSENNKIEQINYKWFGVLGASTHTQKGVPVTSQIYSFQEMDSDYILQMDVDILIGLNTSGHDYLKPMITALESNSSALTHGFQIFQGDELTSQFILGVEENIAPDVRCCLIDKKRLLNSLPLPNHHSEKGWELTWYRALEQHQKDSNYTSLRGGDTATYYCHIQNYRKENRWVWHTLQQVFKNGVLPLIQIGNPEIVGDIFDWCIPKRNEDLVVLFYVDTTNQETFITSFQTLLEQDSDSVGIVIINNSGNESAFDHYQHHFKSNTALTWIHFENKVPYNEAIYKAIHYYLNEPDTFVALLKQGDLLLYPGVLSECMNRLKTYGADVLVGKEISSRSLLDCGISVSNFIHPRKHPNGLANGLQIFRKYLFDSLSHFDLKEKQQHAPKHIATYSKIKQTHEWLNDESGISIMVPIVELSSNPIRFDHFNLLRLQAVSQKNIAEATTFITTKAVKTEGAWQKGRKTFLPNLHKIELDITYDCNLKCFHCNRSCTQAPTQSHMTLAQIKNFVQESIVLDKKWHLINVLGGEPTIHPEFAQIINCLLYEYVIPFSPETTLQVTSNGFGDEVKEKLAALPQHPNLIVNNNSFKEDKEIPYFTPFNLAPKDEVNASLHDYKKGCWVTSYCGIGLNHLGYFACGVAGGIERVLQTNRGIKCLQEVETTLLQEQLHDFCQWCGNFSAYAGNQGDFMDRAEKDSAPKRAMSDSWKEIYKQHNKHEIN